MFPPFQIRNPSPHPHLVVLSQPTLTSPQNNHHHILLRQYLTTPTKITNTPQCLIKVSRSELFLTRIKCINNVPQFPPHQMEALITTHPHIQLQTLNYRPEDRVRITRQTIGKTGRMRISVKVFKVKETFVPQFFF